MFLSTSFEKTSYAINIFLRELAGFIPFFQIFIIKMFGGLNSETEL